MAARAVPHPAVRLKDLGRKLRTAASAARTKHLAATDSRRAGAEAVTAGANKAAGLESALHDGPRKSNAAPKDPIKQGRPKRSTAKQKRAVTGPALESQGKGTSEGHRRSAG